MESALWFFVNMTPQHHPAQIVADSWRRCRVAGLAVGQPLPLASLPEADLEQRRQHSTRLLAYAGPMLAALREHCARSHACVVLADGEGVILAITGSPEFMVRGEPLGLRPGCNWSEHQMGTNAIGTALVARRTVEILGSQHYLQQLSPLNSIATPIQGPAGELLGVLDICGDAWVPQTHAAAMLEITAGMIEDRLVETVPGAAVLLHLQACATGFESPFGGFAAFTRTGGLLAWNSRMPAQLQGLLQPGQCFEMLFATDWQQVLEQGGEHAETAMPLKTPYGAALLARVSIRPGGMNNMGSLSNRERKTECRQLTLADMGCEDSVMAEAVRRASRIVDAGIPLLIQGETGSGKEWFARAFHNSSGRRGGPFVAVNCAAIPATLIEAELFGYAEGAFTGASSSGTRGKLREAHGGTLFLDEIGDMPLGLQAVLLRVLETRRVTPLGGQDEEFVDLMLVCASHQGLRQRIEEGQFRADLFYRLSGMTVTLPPLRQRSDFKRLLKRMLAEECGGREIQLEPQALERLQAYAWPGNLRQLRNVLRLSLALLGEGQCLSAALLPVEILEAEGCERQSAGGLRAVQARLARETVARHGGNISAAARELGITRTTLYRKLGEAG